MKQDVIFEKIVCCRILQNLIREDSLVREDIIK